MFDFLIVINKSGISELHETSVQKVHLLEDVKYCTKLFLKETYAALCYAKSGEDSSWHYFNGKSGVMFLGEAFTNNKYKQLFGSAHRVDSEFLYSLYRKYQDRFIDYIKGIFVVVVFDGEQQRYLVYTSRSGLLRVYFSSTNEFLVVSTTIDSIKNYPGICNDVDPIGVIEHSLFDYPLGDRTHFTKIKSLPGMSFLKYDCNTLRVEQYWSYASALLREDHLSWQETYAQTPIVFNETMELLTRDRDHLNSGLTAGFDSRCVLSYLTNSKKQVTYFTYGLPNSVDVNIAQKISKRLGNQHRYIDFSDKEFSAEYETNAAKLLFFSDGFGNIKRTNQIYAQRKLSQDNNYMLSGYFGSELIRPRNGTDTLIRPNMIKLLMSQEIDKDVDDVLRNEDAKSFLNHSFLRVNKDEVANDISKELAFKSDFNQVFQIVEYWLLHDALGRFFSQEFHSSRIYSLINSPFIDDDFVDFLLQTPIPTLDNQAFQKKSKELKFGNLFYLPIIKTNCAPLMDIVTNRYFTPRAISSSWFPYNVILPYSLYKIKSKLRIKPAFNSREWNKAIEHNIIDVNHEIFHENCLDRNVSYEYPKETSLIMVLT